MWQEYVEKFLDLFGSARVGSGAVQQSASATLSQGSFLPPFR